MLIQFRRRHQQTQSQFRLFLREQHPHRRLLLHHELLLLRRHLLHFLVMD